VKANSRHRTLAQLHCARLCPRRPPAQRRNQVALPPRLRKNSLNTKVTGPAADLRSAIERHLWRLAAKEMPLRVLEYDAVHQLPVRRITVRNQRSRWGSCSRRGTISLNWRLIQSPPFVRDYIILHELMHLREMNHSIRFWREVKRKGVKAEWPLVKASIIAGASFPITVAMRDILKAAARLVEQWVRLGPAFDGPRFASVGPIAHQVSGQVAQ